MADGAGLCHHFCCSGQPLDDQRDPDSYQCCFYVSRKCSRIGCDRVRSRCPFWGVSSRDLAPLRRGFLRLKPSQGGGSAGASAVQPRPSIPIRHAPPRSTLACRECPQGPCNHETLTTNSPRFVAPYWTSGYKGPRSDPVSSRIREAARSSRWHPYPVPTRDPPTLPPGSYEVSKGP